jgi:hypothetical protein
MPIDVAVSAAPQTTGGHRLQAKRVRGEIAAKEGKHDADDAHDGCGRSDCEDVVEVGVAVRSGRAGG